MTVLSTTRLTLRPPAPGDGMALARLANDRAIAIMLTRLPHPYGLAEAEDFIAAGGDHFLVLSGDTPVGCVGLATRDGETALGYWIGRPFQGRGYATEAAQALVDHAFATLGLARLAAQCRVLNGASRRVLHKCGFQYAGEGLADTLLCGRVAVERYRLDRAVWAGLRAWGK